MSKNNVEPIEATIAELKPGMKSVNVTFKVLSTSEERSVESRRSGDTYRVVDAVVGDATGIVTMPIWNETIDSIETGETYRLANGYTGLFKHNLRLQLGKAGTLTSTEESIDEVNESLDMSVETHNRF